jgi:hypothetical protein
VLVLDAVTSGYGLGANAVRAVVDAIAKLSAQYGMVLIVVEETNDLRANSPWPFAMDHVFELELGSSNANRTLSIAKARFCAAIRGPHLVQFAGPSLVSPALEAYVAQATLERFAESSVPTERGWSRIYTPGVSSKPFWNPEHNRAYVIGSHEAIVRAFASELFYATRDDTVDISIELGASELDSRDMDQPIGNSLVVAGRAPPEVVMDRLVRTVNNRPRKPLGRIFCGDLRGLSGAARLTEWRHFLETVGDMCRALRVPLVLWDSSSARFDATNVVVAVRELPPLATLADWVCEVVPKGGLKAFIFAHSRSEICADCTLTFPKLLAG